MIHPLLERQLKNIGLEASTLPNDLGSWTALLERMSLMYSESERERNLLRTLIDSVPANVYIKDTQSRFVDVNAETVLKLGGKTPNDLIGKTDFDFFTEELAAKYFADEQALFRSDRPMLNVEELTFNHQTGQNIWFLTTKAPIRNEDGEVTGLVGVGLEITERKRIEKALEEERTLLRTLIDAMPDYIYIKDRESRFVMRNTATALSLGAATPDDIVGKTDFDFHAPDLAARFYAEEQALLQSGKPLLNQEEIVIDQRTGEQQHLLSMNMPLYDSQGQITGLVGINRDITERKQTEEVLRESERLRLALEKEKELSDLKTQLMITISHEFRTPLTIAYASAELLERYYERMPVAQRETHLDKIENQITKLIGMLEDISLLIHARFGQLTLNLESTDLKKTCEAAILKLDDFDEAQQRIAVNIDERLPKLMVDTRRIQYVLTNLLSNALKYSGHSMKVSLDLFRYNEGVMIQVTDNGIGIPHEEQARLFEPFYRANNVGAVGGTGLGLSIVKEIVEMHKGTIGLKSEVNQGTQVTVFLPAE